MTARISRMRPSRGITLTEILIAIMILGVGLVSLATLFPIGLLRLRDATRYDANEVSGGFRGGRQRVAVALDPLTFGGGGSHRPDGLDQLSILPVTAQHGELVVGPERQRRRALEPAHQDTAFYGDFPLERSSAPTRSSRVATGCRLRMTRSGATRPRAEPVQSTGTVRTATT